MRLASALDTQHRHNPQCPTLPLATPTVPNARRRRHRHTLPPALCHRTPPSLTAGNPRHPPDAKTPSSPHVLPLGRPVIPDHDAANPDALSLAARCVCVAVRALSPCAVVAAARAHSSVVPQPRRRRSPSHQRRALRLILLCRHFVSPNATILLA